jgi:YecR-like lipoprotein
MPRLLSILAAIAVLAGCEAVSGFNTYKTWEVAATDPDLGLVQLSYSYGRFESPQVDERAGSGIARERCTDWGFRDAARKSEDRQCVSGNDQDCSKWLVTREYQCLKDPAK